MKQTAVQWLIEGLFELRNPTLNQIEIIKQALEIEKQQIIDCCDISYMDGWTDNGKSGEEYYNQTYKE